MSCAKCAARRKAIRAKLARLAALKERTKKKS